MKATAKKVIPLTSPQRPQEARALPEFCTHVACPHEKPESETDLEDNVESIIARITALFEAIETMEFQNVDGGGELANLGRDLCEELSRRVHMRHYGHTYFK